MKDLFFDIDQEKDSSDEEEEEEEKKIGNQDNLEYSEKINDGSSNNKDANEQDILKFKEFYQKNYNKIKKERKGTT